MCEKLNNNVWDRVNHFINESKKNIVINEKEILKERAKILSYEKTKKLKKESIFLTIFQINGNDYAIESNFIQEVILVKDILEIPFTPEYVIGVFNLRGKIFSLIDIKNFLSFGKKELNESDSIIIVSNQDIEFGIIIDKVIEVRNIDYETIQNFENSSGLDDRYILGTTKDKLLILNIEQILSDEKIIVNDEI